MSGFACPQRTSDLPPCTIKDRHLPWGLTPSVGICLLIVRLLSSESLISFERLVYATFLVFIKNLRI